MNGVPTKASKLFDPRVPVLKEVFADEPDAFPTGEYAEEEWLNVLVDVGLKSKLDADTLLQCARKASCRRLWCACLFSFRFVFCGVCFRRHCVYVSDHYPQTIPSCSKVSTSPEIDAVHARNTMMSHLIIQLFSLAAFKFVAQCYPHNLAWVSLGVEPFRRGRRASQPQCQRTKGGCLVILHFCRGKYSCNLEHRWLAAQSRSAIAIFIGNEIDFRWFAASSVVYF